MIMSMRGSDGGRRLSGGVLENERFDVGSALWPVCTLGEVRIKVMQRG